MSLESRYMDMKPETQIKLVFVLLIVIFTTILFLYALGYTSNKERISENKERISDIQASRVSSCRQTYEGMIKALRPILTTPPRTPRRALLIVKFDSAIALLIQGCAKQTKPR